MAFEENLRSISFDADASLGIYTGVPGLPGSAVPNIGLQYRFVKITGTLQVGLATAGTDLVVGILQNKPQLPGAAATVGYEGVSFLVVAAPCAAGVLLGPDANGRAVVDAANGRWVSLKPGTVLGELIPAFRVR